MLGFTAGRLLTAHGAIERPLLLVDQGRIVEAVPRAQREPPTSLSLADFGDATIAPGYFDLHFHGAAGYDVMDDAPEALSGIEHFLTRHGVTSYFPTTITAPIDQTLHALERLADAIDYKSKQEGQRTGRAVPLGIHLEGPFISHVRRGVHPAANLLPPTLAAFERLWQAARGHVRMMTIAPELEGALELVSAAAARGVCVSLGHSDGDLPTAQRAIARGARHATHTFNAMRPLMHRDPGISGAVLTEDGLSADIIADGIHLDPAIVKLVALAKGPERTVLITDAISATGMPDGRYHLGAVEVEVKDGKCTAGGRLAGSVLTLDRAVRNLAQFAGWSLDQAVAAASRNPARVVKCPNKGSLAAGSDADFVVLDSQGNILRTFVGGIECPQ